MPLAHGSGVDEAILVLLPLAIVVVLLRLGAKKMPPEDDAPDAEGDAAAATGDPPQNS